MMENASVALMMLDIASAKSTLTQLQQTFTAADAEHQRTRSQLQHLQDQKQDVHPLYTQLGGNGSTALAHRATAQQLQALHTENLQLKCLLKQEIEARQQLESQHAALLEMLRSQGLQDILTADQLDASPVSAAHNSKRQQAYVAPLAGTAGTQQTATGLFTAGTAAAPAAPDQQPLRNSINSFAAEATIPAVRMPVGGNPETGNSTFSSSSNSFKIDASAGGAGASTAGYRRSQAEAMCPSSAYFPHQLREQQQQHVSHQGTGVATAANHESAADAHCRASHPAAESAGNGVNGSRPGKGNSIPRQLFSQHDQRHAQQQQQHQPHHLQQQRQHRHSAPQFVESSWEQLGQGEATATYAATHGTTSSSGSSYSSSCSHSQASEQLLDSDDLEELATLCDGLINQTQGFEVSGQQQQQQLQHQMAELAGPALAAVAAAAAGTAAGAAGRSHSTGPYSSTLHHDESADMQHLQRTHSQPMRHPGMPLPQPQPAATPPVNLTDIEQLAARLQQLQQQVAAAGFAESGRIQRSSLEGGMPGTARPAGAAGSSAPQQQQQQQQQPGTQGARQTSSHSGINSGASSINGARSRAASSSGGNMLQQQQQQLGGESSGVADLQQQLAQRMQEVKQRLRNICNGMLEDAMTSSACGKAGGSTTPAADDQPPAAASQGFHAWHSDPVKQQQQNVAPPAAAGAAWSASAAAGAQDSMAWGSSRRSSSSSTNGNCSSPVGPKTQQQQPSSHDTTTCAQGSAGVGGVRRPVAFTVHAHAAPAPGAGTVAGGPLMRGPAGGSMRRQRVVQGFWVGDAAQQAAGAGSGAAATVPGPASVGIQMAGDAGGVSAHAEAAEAAVGHDAAYSESSWSTLDDEEDHASNKQQYDQQQQQPPVCSAPLGDEAITPSHAGSKSRSARGTGTSADDSARSSPSSSSPRLPQQQHPKQHCSGPWRPPRHADMSQSLEGVLFGMGGRISGEVSQTFSPLKMPAGQSFWSPGSPLTPMKQGKP